MAWWSRVVNLVRDGRVTREIDEELASHLEEAVAHGRDPLEARRAFGSPLRWREESRDIKLLAWLDSLRADAVFGWRQLRKHTVTSVAAVLSLALAIGACTSAFRLIDALLLRPLPVAAPERLYSIARHEAPSTGVSHTYEDCEYPMFRRMRAAVGADAELLAISPADPIDLTYGSDYEMERAYRQYVSGRMFGVFRLRPALGRLFTDGDDRTPRAHPYAVLSHDYWTRRFGQATDVVGRTLRMDGDDAVYEIVGVAGEGFIGTETGTVTDVFVPAMMHPGVGRSDWSWFRTWVQLKPGAAVAPVLERLRAAHRSAQTERAQGFAGMSAAQRERFIGETIALWPAAAGVSELQREHGRALAALAVLLVVVLLIACANVANLMTAQAAARAREMALRVSIGAGRWRLVQLVLVESAWLAGLASILGGLFAWWSAPFVVGLLNPPDNPARLMLPVDWRLLGFGFALALVVTGLFGLAPALRASAVKPVSALKDGGGSHGWQRVMHALIGVQVAFCVLVHFVAGLFVVSFDRLAHQPTGFSVDRLLTVDVVANPAQPAVLWDGLTAHLRALPGVESAAVAGWPLMSGRSWNGGVTVDGVGRSDAVSFFLNVSPGWADAMKIPLIAGRDLRETDTSGTAIVNETFVNTYFGGGQALDRSFEKPEDDGSSARFRIVGVVRDARYRDMREPIPPTVYVPFSPAVANSRAVVKGRGTFILRTSSADPLALAPLLRQDVPRARAGFRVSAIRTQQAIVEAHTVRERLLATLATFFAGVALLLSAIGLYGVLDYSVLQRRREIGIRLAIGAPAFDIAGRVTLHVLAIVAAGALAGLALGMMAVPHIDALFYQVKATDPAMLALPSLIMLAATLLAALPPVVRALRIDPVLMLRGQ